jgi:hypothetical protein
MVMTNRYWKKMLTVVVLGAFLVLGLSSLSLAQMMNVLKGTSKGMSDAWKMFDEGQHMVIKGVEMNNQVAGPMGLLDLMKPGSKVVKDGRDAVLQGGKLIAQAEKSIMNSSDPKVMKAGLEELRKGFKIAMDGKGMLEKGLAMNDRVAQSKGVADKFADGNQIVKTGMGTMAQGIKLFMKGNALYQGSK